LELAQLLSVPAITALNMKIARSCRMIMRRSVMHGGSRPASSEYPWFLARSDRLADKRYGFQPPKLAAIILHGDDDDYDDNHCTRRSPVTRAVSV
jgi:hypothetical protein